MCMGAGASRADTSPGEIVSVCPSVHKDTIVMRAMPLLAESTASDDQPGVVDGSQAHQPASADQPPSSSTADAITDPALEPGSSSTPTAAAGRDPRLATMSSAHPAGESVSLCIGQASICAQQWPTLPLLSYPPF